MGKSVKNNDPFAFKPEYNQQVGTAAPAAAPNDPFAFKPEYNADVKKKVGGTPSEVGIDGSSETSPTASESKRETATDFLTKDINQNDFFSSLAAQSDRYFPNTTPGRVNQQAAEMAMREVFRNPNSLQRYANDRIIKLREDIKNIERDQAKLKDYSYADPLSSFGGVVMDQKKYDHLSQQAREKESYIKRLKNNVAEIASDLLLSQQDLSKIDPQKIGREIMRIADPEQEEKFQLAEQSGKVLPGIRREELGVVGLNAVKGFLSRNPNLPNYDKIVKAVNDLEGDFDERNIELTGQRVREKIGAQLYKEGRGSFFGFGYKPATLQEIANNPETGLTESEKKIFRNYVLPQEKKIVGTNIPTSGFTKSFYNAIERGAINMGKTAGDITGLRDESDQAQDLLNQEIEGSRYRPAGESPTAQAQLAYLGEKEKAGKLSDQEQAQKKELENYTYVRNGWSKFKDGVGDLTGQVAMIAMTTKGIGGAGKALAASGEGAGLLGGLTRSTIGTALSNETVGLFVSSYLNAYDGYKQQAIEMMPGKDKAANREAYATTMSSIEALSERIFRDTKVLTAFTKDLSPAIKEITNRFIGREITQQAAKQETEKALTASLKSFGKEYLKATGQESTEEAVVDFANGAASAIFGDQEFDIVKTGQQALNTFLTTALYSPLVAGMAASGAARQQRAQSSFMRASIVDMAANPAQYLQSVEDLQTDGSITQAEANEKIKLIKSAGQYLSEIPAARPVTTKTGEGEEAVEMQEDKAFDYPETASYLIHRLNEGILNEQIANTTDEVVKSQLQKQLKRSEEIRKGLFSGSISVTPDLREVTDNPEEAAELGIFDAAKLAPDELIGTPFERETEKVPRETQNIGNEQESQSQTTEATPAEGEAAGVENQASEAPQVNIPEMRELVAKNIESVLGTQRAILQEASDEDLVDAFRFIAEQSQDENSANQTRETFGNELVNYANQLFPIQKIKENEEEINQSGGEQTGQAGQEINAEEAAQEADVLNEVPAFAASSKKHFEYVPIEEVEKYKEHDREVEKKFDLDTLTEDIRKNGIKEPIQLKVDRSGNALIVEGNTRLAAAKRLGIKNVPVEITEGEFGSINKDKAKPLPEMGASESKRRANDLPLREKGGAFSRGFTRVSPPDQKQKTISGKGKELADKIRSLKTRHDIAQANIFGIGIGIYDGAIETIATAVEQGAALADAINRGIQYIRDNGGSEVDENSFRKHIEDQVSGEKPRIKVQVGGEESSQEKKSGTTPPKKPPIPTSDDDSGEDGIGDYKMTTSGEVNRFLSGSTWADVFGETPSGDQQYETQRLSDMLQDGQNMIAMAQRKWGADVMMYARPLFEFVQGLTDNETTNKKAVLLATLLGELQEAKMRSPERFDAIQQIEKAVFAHYQSFMNQRGKEIVAGRLLRLYRDKYIGDIYADRILDEDQVKAKKKIQEAQENKKIDDAIAAQPSPSVTTEEKKKEDAAAKKKTEKAQKDRSKKKKMSTTEAEQRANEKMKDIEERLGKEGKGGLINKIKEAIKKLNCK